MLTETSSQSSVFTIFTIFNLHYQPQFSQLPTIIHNLHNQPHTDLFIFIFYFSVDDMINSPYDTRSDSFYFVENKLIMHNKADYAYNGVWDEENQR